jgi:hypothetical protein
VACHAQIRSLLGMVWLNFDTKTASRGKGGVVRWTRMTERLEVER